MPNFKNYNINNKLIYTKKLNYDLALHYKTLNTSYLKKTTCYKQESYNKHNALKKNNTSFTTTNTVDNFDLSFILKRNLSLYQALQVILFASRNNKRILFVGDPRPLVQKTQQKLLNYFIKGQCKLYKTFSNMLLPPISPLVTFSLKKNCTIKVQSKTSNISLKANSRSTTFFTRQLLNKKPLFNNLEKLNKVNLNCFFLNYKAEKYHRFFHFPSYGNHSCSFFSKIYKSLNLPIEPIKPISNECAIAGSTTKLPINFKKQLLINITTTSYINNRFFDYFYDIYAKREKTNTLKKINIKTYSLEHDVNSYNLGYDESFKANLRLYQKNFKLISKSAYTNSHNTATLAQLSNSWHGGFFSNSICSYKQNLSNISKLNLKYEQAFLKTESTNYNLLLNKAFVTPFRGIIETNVYNDDVTLNVNKYLKQPKLIFSKDVHYKKNYFWDSKLSLAYATLFPLEKKTLMYTKKYVKANMFSISNLKQQSNDVYAKSLKLQSFYVINKYQTLNYPVLQQSNSVFSAKMNQKTLMKKTVLQNLNATSPWLKSVDFVFFCNPEKSKALLSQINRLGIPTLGIVEYKKKSNVCISYPIYGYPDNNGFIIYVLEKISKLLRRY